MVQFPLFTIMQAMQERTRRSDRLPLTPQILRRKAAICKETGLPRFHRAGIAKTAMSRVLS